MPTVVSDQVIADGFGERTDPNALVIGPTGVALDRGTLYVADTLGSRIAAISNPLGRKTTWFTPAGTPARPWRVAPRSTARSA